MKETWKATKMALLLAMAAGGCVTTYGPPGPHQSARRDAEYLLQSAQYEAAFERMDEALHMAPVEAHVRMEDRWRRQLENAARREYRRANWDASFDLISRARAGAPEPVLRRSRRTYEAAGRKYAEFHYRWALGALETRNLARALEQLELAARAPNQTGARARREHERWAAVRGQAERDLESVDQLIGREKWEDALAQLRAIEAVDSSLGGEVLARRRRIDAERLTALIRDAGERLDRGEFEAAYTAVGRVLREAPDRADALELRGRIQRAFSEAAAADMRAALAEDDRERLETLAGGYERLGRPADAQRIRTLVAQRAEVDVLLDEARRLDADGLAEAAIEKLRAAAELWPEHAPTAALLRRVRSQAARQALAQGARMMESDFPLAALLYASKARALAPDEAPLEEAVAALVNDAVEGQRREDLQVWIRTAVQVDASVETPLDRARLEERTRMGLPSAFGFIRLLEPAAAPPQGEVLSLLVDVNRLTAETERTLSRESLRYAVGAIEEPNPQHERLQRELASAQDALARARQRRATWAGLSIANYGLSRLHPRGSAGARLHGAGALGSGAGAAAASAQVHALQEQVHALQAQLQATPATQTRTVHADHEYNVETYTRRGEMHASFRLLSGGEIVGVRPLRETFEQSDRTHEGFAPAGLTADPLTLPGEADVRVLLAERLYRQAADAAEELLDAHWRSRLDGALAVRDAGRRWNDSVKLALQNPALGRRVVEAIRRSEPNVPPTVLDEIRSAWPVDE